LPHEKAEQLGLRIDFSRTHQLPRSGTRGYRTAQRLSPQSGLDCGYQI